MHWKRLGTAAAAGMLAVSMISGSVAAADQVNDDGYDLSGFAYQWPEVFSKDDTVTVTENSYKSHDVSVQITKVAMNRVTGDLNEDNTVTVQDAVLCCRRSGGDVKAILSETAEKNADCNEDGDVNVYDLTMMLRYLARLIPESEFFTDHHQMFHVVDVHVRSIESLRGAFAKGSFPDTRSAQLDSVGNMARENNAIFAINCDYCELRDNGITYRNGVMYREKGRAEVCVIYKNGEMKVLTDAEYRALNDEEKAEIWQTTAFSPGLVTNGVAKTGLRGSIAVANPRSGIGYYEPGHYVFVQADGRQPGYAVGPTLDEYAAFFASLGVKEAFNMDGGSSSEIIFNGETYNSPSGIQIGSTGGRYSSDILYICEVPQE